ncbi:MAG: chemotaxis response regulator protein-glutamate methylesterase [Betaproteobacteria bacterium]|nr:chemotaxis response regulator protein-glutamate methylesterase [Betaproteobacteria bacterium]NBY72154.1 chemotaxis response regulator protein-glutamate methylesterase [Betaproteobacteria bacterium]NDD11317.1 chemotaxis response regulator protein-glutamate methylesterase [Betaproteobacteria bacterium]
MTEVSSAKIEVLVADDSSMMRRIVATAFDKHDNLHIAAFATNGLEAVDLVRKLQPDVVVLDIEMPEMDGIEALREIRKEFKRLPIVMFSTLTQKGAQEAVMALTIGATDYVGKPTSAAGSINEALKVLEDELIPKVIGLGERVHRRDLTTPASVPLAFKKLDACVETKYEPTPPDKPTPAPILVAPAKAVVIGVSTGGPMALMQIFGQLKQPLTVPVFIVQHMPPTFTTLLAARLTANSEMTVREPESGEKIESGIAYLAPGGMHMALVKEGAEWVIRLNTDPPENSCRPAVDVLFRSAAQMYGKDLLGVILTGMGQDGLKGCEQIKAMKGQVIAQDEASSVIWGMPMAVVKHKLADTVLPLDKITDEIVFRTRKI